jgi:hypothetical protein
MAVLRYRSREKRNPSTRRPPCGIPAMDAQLQRQRGVLIMPLDPLTAFAITLLLSVAGVAYTLRMASLERRGSLQLREPLPGKATRKPRSRTRS